MLHNILSLLLLGLCCIGFAACFTLKKTVLSQQLMLGLLCLAFLVQICSFFTPLSAYLELAVIALALLGLFRLYKAVLWPKPSLYLAFSALVIAFLSSYNPFIYDHFGYYVPSILYLDHFRLIPGLGNVELNYAQMSPWHMLQTLFSHYLDPYLRLNQLVFLIFGLYIWEQKKYIFGLALPIFALFLHSPSPDLPAYAFGLIILNESWLHKNNGYLMAWAILIASIKPSLFWLPLFLFFKASFMDKIWQLKTYLPAIFLLGIYLFKNIYLFGFPIFPMQILDFGLSWKPHPDILKQSAEVAIIKTYDAQYSLAEIQNFSTWEKMYNWLTIRGMKAIVHCSFLLIWLLFIFWLIQQKSRLYYLLALALLLKSIVVLGFSAQYRFFIDAELVMLFLMLERYLRPQLTIFVTSGALLLCCFCLSFPALIQAKIPSFKLGQMMQGFSRKQLIQPNSFAYKQYTLHQCGNFSYQVVKAYPFGFDTPMMAISPSQLKLLAQAGVFPQWEESAFGKKIIWKVMKVK